MKPAGWKRLAVATAIEAAVLLVLYGLMAWRVGATDVVARLFAAGPQVALGDLGLAVAFLALRVGVVVLLPAILAYRGVRVVGAVGRQRARARRHKGDRRRKGKLP